jgi:hypothetical protein
MVRIGKTLAALVLPAAFLAFLACDEAVAQNVDTAFQFEGLQITPHGGSVNIGFLSLSGPITRDNTGLVEYGTTLNLDNPLPVGVGDTFTLSWLGFDEVTDPMTETSVTGDFDSFLTIVATGMISTSGDAPTPSKLTLVFADAGLNGTFTTLTSLTPVPEMSSWLMLALGFAGLGAVGLRRARRPVRAGTSLRRRPYRHIPRMRA